MRKFIFLLSLILIPSLVLASNVYNNEKANLSKNESCQINNNGVNKEGVGDYIFYGLLGLILGVIFGYVLTYIINIK